jgi:hypothetical protein
VSAGAYCGVIDRHSNGEWKLPVDFYPVVQTACLENHDWLDFTTLDGAHVTLRVADISAFSFVSDDAVEAIQGRVARESFT